MAVRFSIIIPTLNEEKFLPNLLESLTAQTRKDFEVIVSDGVSKDDTVKVARSFAGRLKRLTVVTSPVSGPSIQRNAGASCAGGQWFIFIDADSIVLPYFLERIDRFIVDQKPKHFTSWFRPDTEKIGDAVTTLLGNLMVEGSLLVRRPVAPGPLTVVSRDVFYAIGGYDESRSFAEDYDLTQRIAQKGMPLRILRETLYIYSLRRVRQQGRLRVMQAYAKSMLLIFLTKQAPRNLPEYITGGQLYDKKRMPIASSKMKQYQKKLKKLVKELLA